MLSILVDTGVWYALCDSTDQIVARTTVDNIYEKLSAHSIIFPWPIAYETLRTSFVKKRLALERFEQELKSTRVTLVDDARYRENALELAFQSSLRRNRPLSMVDCLMRLLMEDIDTKIECLVTFNAGDFVDVCRKRNIELWTQ